MNFEEVNQQVREGKEARREGWDQASRKIRLSNTGDHDYINSDNLDGTIVVDCPEQTCDCVICIYSPSKQDVDATDWVLLN